MLNVAIAAAVKVEGTALAAGVVDSANFRPLFFLARVHKLDAIFTLCVPWSPHM